MVAETDTVMVIGCGMVGLGAVVGASSRGAMVIAADIDKEKLELSKQMGASYALDTTDASFHKKLREITGGNGPDVIIEAVGSPATYRLISGIVSYETAQKAMEYWSENPGKVFRILLDTTDTPRR